MPKKSKGKDKGKEPRKKSVKSESALTTAAANSSLWEARLEATEKLKQEYKEHARKLLMENHALQTKMQQMEWETVDVITFLKKQDAEREGKIDTLKKEVTDVKVQQQDKIETVTSNYVSRINDLEDKLNAKRREAEIYHNELKLVQEFRKKREDMEKEIEELKKTLEKIRETHIKDLAQCEKKFLEDKYKLQQETSKRIAELAEKAHQEAILNMNDTTKLVYKENVRLTEALKYHMDETNILSKARENYTKEREDLTEMMRDQKMVLHNKILEIKRLKSTNAKICLKVDVLEKSVHHMVKQFENQREACTMESKQEIAVCKSEIERQKQILEIKTKEMNKVKRLARTILEQRTELETFFIEAINYVRHEITSNQQNYIYEAKLAYQRKMLEANFGKTDFPKVRTFNNLEHSTNDVYEDFEAAAIFEDANKKISIHDMTWEQMERVLQFMFAKMNGSCPKAPAPPLPPLPAAQKMLSLTESRSQPSDQTFLTQLSQTIKGNQLITS